MAGSSAREFRVGMDEADLKACKAAGVKPEELVKSAVRAALADLVPIADDEEMAEEAPATEESEVEEEPVAEEETESDEAAPF